MNRSLSLILIALLSGVALFGCAPLPAVQADTTVGPAYSISYQPSTLIFEDWSLRQYGEADPQNIELGIQRGFMLLDDANTFILTAYEKSSSNDVLFEYDLMMASPYTNVKNFCYDLKWYDNDASSSVTCRFYLSDPSQGTGYQYVDLATENTYYDANFTVTSSIVTAGHVYAKLQVFAYSSYDTYSINILIDQLCLAFNAVAETRTSTVSQWSDGTTRYEGSFTSFDYGVTATITPPTTPNWTFHSVNPNTTRSGWQFSNLVPFAYVFVANGTNTRVDAFLWLTFTDASGHLVPWGTFYCYVNASLLSMAYRPIIGTYNYVNVTLIDDFGTVLYQNESYPLNATGDTFLSQNLTVYRLILANRRPYPQYARVSQSGVTITWSVAASPGTFSLLVAPGSYQVAWIRCSDGSETDSNQWTVVDADCVASSGYELPQVDFPYGPDPPEAPNYIAIAELLVILLLFFLLVVALLRRGGHAAPGTSEATYTEAPGGPRSSSYAAAPVRSAGAAAERDRIQRERAALRELREQRRQSRRR